MNGANIQCLTLKSDTVIQGKNIIICIIRSKRKSRRNRRLFVHIFVLYKKPPLKYSLLLLLQFGEFMRYFLYVFAYISVFPQCWKNKEIQHINT